MCGICGLVWRPSVRGDVSPRSNLAITAMLDAMGHRGPDGQGRHVAERHALGHLRLAIIDVEGAPQPMSSPDGNVALSFNGEIYNFAQLMEDQKRRGWQFRTRSDTEVLLAGYIQDGRLFDDMLNGMYAYAVLDEAGLHGGSGGGRLQLGIDPVGVKPLYVWEGPDAVLFASELRGILAALRALEFPVAIDRRALAQFLAQGWVPQPGSLVQGVRKLTPGARMEIDLSNGQTKDLPPRTLPAARAGNLEEVLFASVRRQVIADVPVGFFLSGGIDSSLLVSVAHQMGLAPRTFTVRFEGEGHGIAAANEADVAALVAAHCNAEHHELRVNADILLEELDAGLAAMDQPIADPACLPLLVMSRFAQDHVKVCLSGDGGDELFQGYPRHALTPWKRRWHGLPPQLRDAARSIVQRLPTSPSTGLAENLRRIRVGFGLLDDPEYIPGPFSGHNERLLTVAPDMPDWMMALPTSDTAMFEADMRGQLSGQMLPKTDHVSMYASLECRVPFLDLEMVAFAQSISGAEKRAGGLGKAPLRSLLSRYLPDEVTKRPKHGFRVPLTDWFRTKLASSIRGRLLDPGQPVAGMMRRTDLEQLLAAHISGRAEHSIRIWSLLALQAWLDRNGLSHQDVGSAQDLAP